MTLIGNKHIVWFQVPDIQKAQKVVLMLKYQMGGGWGIARGNAIIFFKIEVLMSGSVKSRKQSSKPSITYWNLQKNYMIQY